jgi:Flp pilus assembly protein TadG
MAKCLQKEISTRTRPASLRRLKTETRGAELVEFAYVIWILMGLLILVFWCGRAYSVYQAVERAAREGARVYLASTCATCGNAQNDPTATIDRVLSAASLDPAQAIPPPTFTPNQVLVASNPPNSTQVSGVTVVVSYPLQLNMPLLSWFSANPAMVPSVTIRSTVSMRQEY